MGHGLRILRLVVPLLVALAAAALKLLAEQRGLGMVLAALGGYVLGWSAVLGVESVATLLGLLPCRDAPSDERRRELEAGRVALGRALREVEMDVKGGKLSPEDAATLRTRLDEQIKELDAELEQARCQAPPSTEADIERVVAARLQGGKGDGS
jgi:hypothetical protein